MEEVLEIEKNLVALIDGDEILYKVGFASEHMWYYIYDDKDEYLFKLLYKKQAVEYCKKNPTHRFKPEIIVAPAEDAISNLHTIINNILEDLNTSKCRIFLNGKDNFREKLATLQPYKGNRNDSRKPVHFDLIKETLIEEYFAEVVDGFESDDAMAIHQSEDTIICTQDKDLDMVPGYRYNISKREVYKISEIEAMRSFYGQLVQGDSTDNIPGIAGIGKVTAERLFKKCTDDLQCFEIVLTEYNKAIRKLDKNPLFMCGALSGIILEIGNLLWMLRSNEDKWEFPTLDKSTWRFIND